MGPKACEKEGGAPQNTRRNSSLGILGPTSRKKLPTFYHIFSDAKMMIPLEKLQETVMFWHFGGDGSPLHLLSRRLWLRSKPCQNLEFVCAMICGQAVARGNNARGQCNIPPLDEGLCYTQVAASIGHTVLFRSDGKAVACEFECH